MMLDEPTTAIAESSLPERAESLPKRPVNRTTDYSKLSREEMITALHLASLGKTQVQIGQALGCTHSSISRLLRDYGDTRELAKKKTHNAALRVAEAAIDGSIKAARDGKPQDALELLDRLDVAPKRQVDTQRIGVMVVVNQPGQTRVEPPTIRLSPAPHSELPGISTG